jgi:phosphoesterase RecJ-like protein
MDQAKQIVSTVGSWQRFVVVGHVTPDADALAAMIAVAGAFAEPGRCETAIALPKGSVSLRLAFMLEDAKPVIAGGEDFVRAEGFVVLDTAKPARCNVGDALGDDWAAGRPIVNIDHHASNTRFGDLVWVDPNASSTSELIHRLLCVFDMERTDGSVIPPPIASLLYAGMLTDTAGFTLPTTGSRTLQAAADLVARGADVAAIGEQVYRSQTASEFRLLRTIYDNTHVIADGRLAYSTAGYDEIIGAGCTAVDIDEQVNVPRSLRGVHIALLLTEGNRGKTRINFRGESGVAVLPLARSFGGGGHAEAAGAILDKPLDAALPEVLEKATAYLERLSASQL